MAKREKQYKNLARREAEGQLDAKSLDRRKRLRTLLLILAITLATALIYYGACAVFAYAFLIFYAAAILLGVGYVIANYGFARNGVTPDMLPPTMPLEDRRRYVEERDRRKASTNWMLMLLIPLLLVIGFDVLYLYWGESFIKFFRSL